MTLHDLSGIDMNVVDFFLLLFIPSVVMMGKSFPKSVVSHEKALDFHHLEPFFLGRAILS